MKNPGSLVLFFSLVIGAYAAYAQGDVRSIKPCLPYSVTLSELNLQQPPRRVLLVPLLSGVEDINENPRWPEEPARHLQAFYRNRFGAKVMLLRDIWRWTDYYRQVEHLSQQGHAFDRIIFISHGGYDGPILKNAVYLQEQKATGSTIKMLQLSEAQPGLKNVLVITYNTEKNQLFNDYMAAHWKDFGTMEFDAVGSSLRVLKNLSSRWIIIVINVIARQKNFLYGRPNNVNINSIFVSSFVENHCST